jgi:hypothetical protein
MKTTPSARTLPAGCLRAKPLPPPTGLRVGVLPDVQLVCQAGAYGCEVFVRVLGGDQVEIVGQVTWAARFHEPVSHLDVVLFDADAMEPVGRVKTDHFGEFDLGRLPSGRYYVALGVAQDAPCVLVWEGDE